MSRRARNIGLDVPTPSKTCQDTHCPFHGNLPVRGISFEGKVVSFKMDKTGVVEREYLHFIRKLKRYERRRSRVNVHIPPCLDVRVGDIIEVVECRPISKTVAFVGVAKKEVK